VRSLGQASRVDTQLTRCVKIAMEKRMAVDPVRGGKSSYTVTHEF
jgi:hypothetical protein